MNRFVQIACKKAKTFMSDMPLLKDAMIFSKEVQSKKQVEIEYKAIIANETQVLIDRLTYQ